MLVMTMGLVALLAQVAGVGGTKPGATKATAARAATLNVIPGGSVPDIASTKLQSAKVSASQGEVVQMRATATVRAANLPARAVAQVVCGIRYSRDGDPSWSLGAPSETVQLPKRGASDTITIERTLNAPASDTYRMSTACHVAAPTKGVQVTATGTMRASLRLPTGAAQPVG